MDQSFAVVAAVEIDSAKLVRSGSGSRYGRDRCDKSWIWLNYWLVICSIKAVVFVKLVNERVLGESQGIKVSYDARDLRCQVQM